MGSDLFIHYSCRYRQEGDTSLVAHLLRLKRHLDSMESGENPSQQVRVLVWEEGGPKEQVYTRADLNTAVGRLSEVYHVCDSCPANLKRAFGIRGSIGCHAFVVCPLDDFAERILYETLVENAKPERAATEQSNLIRALVATTPGDGQLWEEAANRIRPGAAASRWGSRPVPTAIDSHEYGVSVHALLEMLFMFPAFPYRAVVDILAFFRSFFAVVGHYVSTPDGKLDQRRNELFWRRSHALNQLNLYIQLLKHAARLGQGVLIEAPDLQGRN